MTRLPKILIAALAMGAAASTAAAAAPERRVIAVALPDGSTAHIEYYGNIAPKVIVVPGRVAWAPIAIPRFDANRVIAQMERQRDAMLRQVQLLSRGGLAVPGRTVRTVSLANAPAGSSRVHVVTVSDGGRTCTRRTEVTSLGPGKAPKVVTSVSGDCSVDGAPAPQAKPSAASRSSAPITRT
jgi:hypothetical protein